MLHELVHVLHLDPGSRGYPAAAGAIEYGGVAAFLLRHGIDDGDLAPHFLLALVGGHRAALQRGLRQLVHERGHATHLLQLFQLALEIDQVETLALGHLLGELLGFIDVNLLLDLLDQCDHVAHAEDASCHAFGIERLQRLEFLAHAHHDDGFAGHLAHRQRGATARVTIGLGEDDAGEVESGTEGARGIHRVLARHGVDDEQALVGFHGAFDLLHLFHEFGVDVQAARGVDDQRVVDSLARGFQRFARDDRRRLLHVRGEDARAHLFRETLQLQYRRGPADVGAD